ncbi:MAG: archaeal proteasome endopeptidase complex subunit alpha [DPANN group archaeon]|nr:archaeal proteasome endopeptidase complex subunit alpha [DPANN group archaeon]
MQVLPSQAMGYDRAITVFSPDGRILQIEYAKKAVSAGAMALGIIYRDGVLLASDRRITEKLLIAESVKKIAQIDDHIISTFAGYTMDARILVKRMRVFAQQHKLTYGEETDVEGVIKNISDLAQAYTQYSGIRPFGISFLLAGVDKKGSQLIMTEPSGIYMQYYAKAIGAGSTEATKTLEKRWKEGMKLEDAKKLAVDVFREVLDKEFSMERLEAAAVTKDGMQKVNLAD